MGDGCGRGSRTGRNVVSVVVVAVLLCAAHGLLACAGPTVAVVAEPEGSEMLVDGERVAGNVLAPDTSRILVDRRQTEPEAPLPAGEARLGTPYYGTVRVEVIPPPPPPVAMFELRPTARMVSLDEPVTPWIFPLDLFVELFTAPWREQHTVIEMRAEGRPPIAANETPNTIDGLRQRATQERSGR